MTLIYHNDVEKVPIELLIRLGCSFGKVILHKLLIETHKNLVTLAGAPLLYLDHLLPKRLEVLKHCLVYQDISVGQIEDSHITALAGLKKAIQYLEGGIGLACSRSHNEHHPLLSSCKGIYNSINNNSLVVAGFSTISVIVVGFLNNL